MYWMRLPHFQLDLPYFQLQHAETELKDLEFTMWSMEQDAPYTWCIFMHSQIIEDFLYSVPTIKTEQVPSAQSHVMQT